VSEFDAFDKRLGRAWQALSPPDELQARVRARLSRTGVASVGTHVFQAPRERVAGGPVRSRWHALRASGVLGASVGAALLGLGIALGYLMPRAAADPPRAPQRASLPAAGPASAPASSTPESSAPAPATSQPAASSSPSTPLPESIPSADRQPHTIPSGKALLAERSSASPRPPKPARLRSRTDGVDPHRSSIDGAAELALLERAERAVRAKHPALALALIEELEQRRPHSPLQEERRSIELMAHCQAEGPGKDTTRRLENFVRRYPESAYSARIAVECAGVSSHVPLTNSDTPDIDGAEGGIDVRNDSR
jgi:hypothetical protein